MARLLRADLHGGGELDVLNAELAVLTRRAAPRLLDRYGVGVETAGQLLVTAGDNPDRLHSDAALAALCGASPVQASSGKAVGHRLNRGGDRQANNALWVIALTRLRDDPCTRSYAERRTKQGKTPTTSCAASSATWPESSSRCSRPTSRTPASSAGHRSFDPFMC